MYKSTFLRAHLDLNVFLPAARVSFFRSTCVRGLLLTERAPLRREILYEVLSIMHRLDYTSSIHRKYNEIGRYAVYSCV